MDEYEFNPIAPRDSPHLPRIRAAVESLNAAEAELRKAVAVAREAGDSWALIHQALGSRSVPIDPDD